MLVKNSLKDIIYKYCNVNIDDTLTDLVDHTSQINNSTIFVLYPPKSLAINEYISTIELNLKDNPTSVIIFIDGAEKLFSEKSININTKLYISTHILEKIVDEYYCLRSKKILGVTGTGGKTSTSCFLYHLGQKIGLKTVLLNTFGLEGLDNKLLPSNINTTYSNLTLRRIIHHCGLNNVDILVLEVSSHGIGENRIKNIKFDGGIWTSMFVDHLEYHKNLEDYFETKKRLFLSLPIKVINEQVIDFGHKNHLLLNLKDVNNCTVFGVNTNRLSDSGFIYQNKRYNCEFKMKFFQRENLMGAMILLYKLGYTNIFLESNLEVSIPYRMELFGFTYSGAPVYSDHAYRPGFIETFLDNYFESYNLKRIILVIGIGGDRDRGPNYRSSLGALSSKVYRMIVTDDFPRGENPAKIRNEIIDGRENIWNIPNRQDALEVAFTYSTKNNIVLILCHGDYNFIAYKNYYSFTTDKQVFEHYLLKYRNQKI